MIQLSVSINNLTAFSTYVEAATSAGRGPLPFVEILWDNYCHLDPARLRDVLGGVASEVSFHVMYSGFLALDEDRFGAHLAHLSAHVREVRPVRVSDHVLCFRQPDELNLISPLENDYADLAKAADRVDAVQQALGMPLLLENYASYARRGTRQVEFFAELIARTGCRVLFDVSNAVVAELNGVCPWSVWLPLLRDRPIDLHVGSYRLAPKTGRTLDTHDADLSPATLGAVRRVRAECNVASVCLERERNLTEGALIGDLRALAAALAHPQEETCTTTMP